MPPVEWYTRADGECPYGDYIEHLWWTGRRSEYASLEALEYRLREWGLQPLMETQKAKKLNDVYELRTKQHRVFFFWDGERQKYVLLNGFRKKSQRTPRQEMARAETLRDEYLKRSRKGE